LRVWLKAELRAWLKAWRKVLIYDRPMPGSLTWPTALGNIPGLI
jgi:hypothetical protein